MYYLQRIETYNEKNLKNYMKLAKKARIPDII